MLDSESDVVERRVGSVGGDLFEVEVEVMGEGVNSVDMFDGGIIGVYD